MALIKMGKVLNSIIALNIFIFGYIIGFYSKERIADDLLTKKLNQISELTVSINSYKTEADTLRNIVDSLNYDIECLQVYKQDLITKLDIYESGKLPKYFVCLESLTYKYIRTRVWVETTEQSYHELRVGQVITQQPTPFYIQQYYTQAKVIDKKITE